MNSICSRGDLLPKPEYGGCYDSKVTHYSMAMQQMAHACNGPTHQVIQNVIVHLRPFEHLETRIICFLIIEYFWRYSSVTDSNCWILKKQTVSLDTQKIKDEPHHKFGTVIRN